MDVKQDKNGFEQVQFLIFFIVIFFVSVVIKPQKDDIEFSHLTAEDGLSLSSITQVLQDRRGFLWVGTFNGLNRFDGYEFKTFLPQPNSTKGISNHSIWSIYEDSQGYIWIGTLDGLNRFDWRTEEFYVYKNNPQDPNSLSSNNILSIYEDKSGILWIGTLNGLNKFNREKNNFTSFKKISDRLNPDDLNSVVTITEDEKGILWLGTWNGLTCIRKDGTVIKQYFSQDPHDKAFDYRMFSVIYKDKQNNLWLGTNGRGLKKYDSRTGRFINFVFNPANLKTISNNFINAIFQDSHNNLWIGTRDGFNKYDSKTNTFIRYLFNNQKPLSIISNEVKSITEDKSGIVWVGTAAGLSKFYISKNKFNYYSENDVNPNLCLTSNRISTIQIDKNENIWVGSFKGLNKINVRTGKIDKFFNQPGNPNSLNDNFLMSLREDHTGGMWIGTNHSGLNFYNPANGTFKSYSYDINNEYSISNNGVTSIFEDSKGNVWMGTWWGLNRFDRKTEKFHRYFHNPQNANSLPHDLVWTIFEDSKGMLWFGTDGGGVSEFNPTTNRFTNFNRDSSGVNKISENRVITIFESRDGVIWFGTNYGLNEYNRALGKTTIYTDSDGLPGNLINGILEDGPGYIWITSDKGLTKFNRKNKIFTNYSKRDGLNELEFTQNVAAKSKNGFLYFGCKSGLIYFHPDSIKDDRFSAPLVFTDLKIFNQSVPISADGSTPLSESITRAKSISIPFTSSVITIDYALLDYYNVKRNNFSYKLVGFDKAWNKVGNRNSATYTNLPPGEYKFIVKAINKVGLNDEITASINITIEPAFYQTWLFRSAAVIIALVVSFLFLQLRTQKIKKQNKVLEKRVSERTKDLDKTIHELSQEIIERKKAQEIVHKSLEEKEILLKEIHHRVKNNLQVISSLLFLQSISIKDEEVIGLFKDSQDRIRCMALIHEKLYQSEDLAGIRFDEYVIRLIEDLEHSYRRHDLKIKSNIQIHDVKLSLDTSMSCGLIVNELITNAYKYAFPTEWIKTQPADFECNIFVKVERLGDGKYLLEISDNGVGISPEIDLENTESLGIKLVYSMANQLNGSIKITNNYGTRFKIIFEDIV